VDVEVDSLHVKRIGIEDLVDYVYIVRVDSLFNYYVCFASSFTIVVALSLSRWMQAWKNW
jgi:hypothetical protein